MRQIQFIPINLEVTSDNHYVAILPETSPKSVFLFHLSISNKITHTVHCYHSSTTHATAYTKCLNANEQINMVLIAK